MAETKEGSGLKEKTEAGAVRMHLIRRLIGTIRFIAEQKRPGLTGCKISGKHGKRILFLFPVIPYTFNTTVSFLSVIHGRTVRADDMREWMEKN